MSIVASYIKERTKNAQFIVISLRNNMVCLLLALMVNEATNMFYQFELAARLVGVYKVNQMVSLYMKTPEPMENLTNIYYRPRVLQ